MNTCKTCKYWASSFNPDKNKMADCDLPATITGDKLCKDGNGTGIDVRASAHDDSGLDARLFTGENFGCMHHTPKR